MTQDRGDRRERQGRPGRGPRPRRARLRRRQRRRRPGQSAEAPFLRADLTDLGETIEALRGADAVVHLAAIPAPRIRTVERTFEINILSTYNVFSAAALLGARTRGLGLERDRARPAVRPARCPQPARPGGRARAPPEPDYAPIDEEHPLRPHSSYSLSKVHRRGDGAPVRPLERTSRSSACASRRSASRPSTRRSPTRGAIRTWASGTCGATSTPGTSAQACRLSPDRRPRAARRPSSSRPATPSWIARTRSCIAECFPSVPLRPGTGDVRHPAVDRQGPPCPGLRARPIRGGTSVGVPVAARVRVTRRDADRWRSSPRSRPTCSSARRTSPRQVVRVLLRGTERAARRAGPGPDRGRAAANRGAGHGRAARPRARRRGSRSASSSMGGAAGDVLDAEVVVEEGPRRSVPRSSSRSRSRAGGCT